MDPHVIGSNLQARPYYLSKFFPPLLWMTDNLAVIKVIRSCF